MRRKYYAIRSSLTPASLLFILLAFSACRSSEPGSAPREVAAGQNLDTLDVHIPGSDYSFRMVPIQAGRVSIGSDDQTERMSDDESPAVVVDIDPFYIGETEVTEALFAIFRFKERDSDSTSVAGKQVPVDAVARPSTPYEDPAHGMGGDGYPAVGMTQWGTLQFARWLSEKTGIFFRLPTEAEWEAACLAGSEDAAIMSQVGDRAWFVGNSDEALRPVATKTPDAAGLYDMLGNAAEWTLDQYDAAFYDSLAARTGTPRNPWREPERLHPRTVRGGSFTSDASELRCAAREESSLRWKRRDPQIPKSFWWNTDSPFVGFRLVAPVTPPAPDEQEAFWRLVLGE